MNGNRFDEFQNGETEAGVDGGEGWKQAPVNGKKWSSVVNGVGDSNTSSPAQGAKPAKDHSVRDNKVAYLLFYQRV